jgi:hypothetical protein
VPVTILPWPNRPLTEFFAARQRVELFDDALPALQFLSQRWPVVALSNGNANVHVVGIGEHFHASLSASAAGMAKPRRGFPGRSGCGRRGPSMCCTSATMRSWMPGRHGCGYARSLAQPRAGSMALRGS